MVGFNSRPAVPVITINPVRACELVTQVLTQCPDVGSVTLKNASNDVLSMDDVRRMTRAAAVGDSRGSAGSGSHAAAVPVHSPAVMPAAPPTMQGSQFIEGHPPAGQAPNQMATPWVPPATSAYVPPPYVPAGPGPYARPLWPRLVCKCRCPVSLSLRWLRPTTRSRRRPASL